jgi:hypothetical protein
MPNGPKSGAVLHAVLRSVLRLDTSRNGRHELLMQMPLELLIRRDWQCAILLRPRVAGSHHTGTARGNVGQRRTPRAGGNGSRCLHPVPHEGPDEHFTDDYRPTRATEAHGAPPTGVGNDEPAAVCLRARLAREPDVHAAWSECQPNSLSRGNPIDHHAILVAQCPYGTTAGKCCAGGDCDVIAAEIGDIAQVVHCPAAGDSGHSYIHHG